MLDKCQMKRRIDYQGRNYKNYCPAFDYDAITARLNDLPGVVSEQESLRLMEQHSHPGMDNLNDQILASATTRAPLRINEKGLILCLQVLVYLFYNFLSNSPAHA